MKRRALAIILAATMLLGLLVGCGGGSKPTGGGEAVSTTPDYTDFDAETFDLSDYDLPEGIDFTQGDPVEINITCSGQTGGTAEQPMWLFKAIVEEATGGRITVNAHNNGTLGTARETFEQMSQGMLEMYCDGGEVPAAFIPILDVLVAPFIFENEDHACAFLDNEEAVAPIYEAFEGSGVVLLKIFLSGFHDICTAAPMKDNTFNGQKIRVGENQINIATINAMGGVATPMAWGEVYTGLQQGTVEGCSTPINCMNLANFYEVQNYVYLTHHFASFNLMCISQQVWDKLSDNDKALLKAATDATVDFSREMAYVMVEEHGGNMENASGGDCQVLEVEDRAALAETVRAQVLPMYENHPHKDLIDTILNLEY